MKDKQLSKLYDLMKVIILSQNKEAIDDLITINSIIWNMINKRHTPTELLWCNNKWKSYEGEKIDLSKKFVFPIYDLTPADFGEHKHTIKLVGFYDWKSLMVWEKTIYKEYIIRTAQLKIVRTFGLVIVRLDDGIIARIDNEMDIPDGFDKSYSIKTKYNKKTMEYKELGGVIKVVITDDGKSIKEIIKT